MRGYHCYHTGDWLNEIAIGAVVTVGTTSGFGLLIAFVHVIMDLLT